MVNKLEDLEISLCDILHNISIYIPILDAHLFLHIQADTHTETLCCHRTQATRIAAGAVSAEKR